MIPLYTLILSIKHGYFKAWKIIVSQFKFETANFTDYKADDPIYNLCGMRPASVRSQNRTGEIKGYATFANYWDGIEDFMLRNKAFGIKDTDVVDEWCKQLKTTGYYEANQAQYTAGVQHYFDVDSGDYKYTLTFFVIGSIAFIGGIVWLFVHFANKKAGIKVGRHK